MLYFLLHNQPIYIHCFFFCFCHVSRKYSNNYKNFTFNIEFIVNILK